MLTLKQLGNKIAIIGPSSAGKSTLAHALEQKIHIPAFYLDTLAHYPNSNWVRIPFEELQQKHTNLLKIHNKWIIEGNYSSLMDLRFSLCSSIIYIEIPYYQSIINYTRRSFSHSNTRKGNINIVKDKWQLSFLIKMYRNRKQFSTIYLNKIKTSHKPFIHIRTMKELKNYYQFWELSNPSEISF